MAAADRDDRLDGADAAREHQHRLSSFLPGLHLDSAAGDALRGQPIFASQPARLVCTAGAFVHGASFGPDYLSYINFPRDQVYWQIDDIDWGQGLKQTRQWIDKNARDGRLIAIWYFGRARSGLMRYYLGDKVTLLEASTHGTTHTPGMQTEKPTHGWLIISAVYEPGAHRHDLSYQVLQKYPPVATIGHCILVFTTWTKSATAKVSTGESRQRRTGRKRAGHSVRIEVGRQDAGRAY